MKGICVYVLELMLNLDTHGLVYRVFWPIDLVIICYTLLEFRTETTGTIPSTTQILRTSSERCASPHLISKMHAPIFIHARIRILHHVMPINHRAYMYSFLTHKLNRDM